MDNGLYSQVVALMVALILAVVVCWGIVFGAVLAFIVGIALLIASPLVLGAGKLKGWWKS